MKTVGRYGGAAGGVEDRRNKNRQEESASGSCGQLPQRV